MAKPLRFKDMINAEPAPGEDELINYRKSKKKRTYSGNEDVEPVDDNIEKIKEKLGKLALKIKKRNDFRRTKQKRLRGLERSKRKMASMDVLKKRAKRSEINKMFKKFAKGKDKADMSYAERDRIEQKLKSPAIKKRIERLAKKTVKDKRKAEMDRKRSSSK
jgi:hypothetical protein